MKLKDYRSMLGITQAKFAEMLGIEELSVIKYEARKTIPSAKTMLGIYQATSGAVTPNDFYELESIVIKNRLAHIPEAAQQAARVAVGLMSGTSMDGIDAALLITDGQRYLKEVGSYSMRYSAEFRARLKGAEVAVRKAEGSLAGAREEYPEIDAVILESTELHGQAVQALLKQCGYKASQIDVVGYHGQTLFHRPSKGITVQVGDGAYLAKQLKIPVVYDFRSNDVRHGGQGAPFAPLYHEALAMQMGLVPVVVANCGGISNVSVITGRSADLIAFDCGPGNGLIDRFVAARTGKPCDQDGVFGLQGVVRVEVLDVLRGAAVRSPDGTNYLDQPPPKSLDINDLILLPELEALSLQDGCATLEAFTAECIVASLDWVEQRDVPIPSFWVLGGGGWKNPVIVRELATRLRNRLGEQVRIQQADAVGWNGTALEAQIFAYLAVRSMRGLPLSVPGTTGVKEPLTGGVLVSP